MPLVNEIEEKAFQLRKEGKTLKEAGEILGVSRERVRQLEFKRRIKVKQGIFAELLTRSLSVLMNLNIKTLGELRERFPEFKNPPHYSLKYKYRGCGDLVYKDLQAFLKRHEDKPDDTSRA